MIDGGVRQGCIMSPWLFNVYMNAVLKEAKMGMGRKGVRFLEDGSVWRLSGLLYVEDLESLVLNWGQEGKEEGGGRRMHGRAVIQLG